MTRPPPPSPLLCSPHSLTPTLLPPLPLSQPVARRLSHAVGAYVFHLDSPPHLCACRSRSLWSQSTMSSCLFTWSARVFFLSEPNHRITFHESWQTVLQHRTARTCKSFHVWRLLCSYYGLRSTQWRWMVGLGCLLFCTAVTVMSAVCSSASWGHVNLCVISVLAVRGEVNY